MTGPSVSVIVVVKNGERYLASALDSIFKQEYQPLEVLVVDDHSSDGTAAIARSTPACDTCLRTDRVCHMCAISASKMRGVI